MLTFCTKSRYGEYERIDETAAEEGIVFTLSLKLKVTESLLT